MTAMRTAARPAPAASAVLALILVRFTRVIIATIGAAVVELSASVTAVAP